MWYCSFLYFLLPQEIVADDELVFVGTLLLDTVQIDSCHYLAVVMKWLTIIFTFLLLSFSFWSLSFFFGIPALKRAYVFLAGVATILNTTHPCDHFEPICHCFCCQTLVVPMACKQCQRSRLRKKGFFYVHSATKNFLKSVGKMQVKLCKSMWLFVSHVVAPPTFVSTNCSTHTSLNGPIRNIHPMGPHLLLRESCIAMETGYIEYDSLPSQIRTGCIRTLKHGSQFCDEHPQNHKEIDKVGIRGKQKYRYNVTFLNIIQTLL